METKHNVELFASQPIKNNEAVNVQIFHNPQFGQIRTTNYNGEPHFCLYDVASSLGYSKPSKAVIDHCKGVTVLETPTNGGVQKLKFGKEAEVYRLIMKSKTPRAEQFQDWVCEDVLPSIRKYGAYEVTKFTIPKTLSEALYLASTQAKTIEEQDVQLQLQAPKVLFADAVANAEDYPLVAELAKILKQEGVEIGQNRLFEWLRQSGYLGVKGKYYNQPTQRSMDKELFRIVKDTITLRNGKDKVVTTTTLTSKGTAYFVKKILSDPSILTLNFEQCE